MAKSYEEATQENPYPAILLSRECLIPEGDESNKETYLLTIDIGSQLVPGSAIGILIENTPEIVSMAKVFLPSKDLARVNLTGRPSPSLKVSSGIGIVDLLQQGVQVGEDAIVLLAPRYYSVCSSPLVSGVHAQIVFNLTEVKNDTGRVVRFGAGFRYLKQVPLGSKLDVFPRKVDSGFRLPQDIPQSSIIMVAAGTGVAPFMGFITHAKILGPPKLMSLYYGVRDCRRFPFKNELDEIVGEWFKMNLAASRYSYTATCCYVQDLLLRDGDAIYRLMTEDPEARIYICGDEMTMVKDVNEALTKICTKHGHPKLLSEWNKSKRVLRDIWL